MHQLMNSSEPGRRAPGRAQRFLQILLAGYWGLLFVATHIPRPPELPRVQHGDKIIHFLAYGLLGILVSLVYGQARSLTLPRAVRLVAVLVVYAALDELLQIPAGRSCEWGDWIADSVGALLGVTGIYVVAGMRQKFSGP